MRFWPLGSDSIAKLRPTTPEEVVEVLKKVSSQTSNTLPSFLNAKKTYQNIFPFIWRSCFLGSFQKGMLGGDFLCLWQLSHLFPVGFPFQAGPSEDPPASVVGTALRQAGLDITAENVLRALKAVKPGEEPSSKDLKIDGVSGIHGWFYPRLMCLKIRWFLNILLILIRLKIITLFWGFISNS